MNDLNYICPKCKNVISVDYWDWSGGECDKCGLDWFWDEFLDEDGDGPKVPCSRIENQLTWWDEKK